ncbi:MAG: hypothetical protein MR270_07465 [Erysipelotrichaceae bacterium]|nr:hypothetical protein [Erysipelotrichaceae bacterium]
MVINIIIGIIDSGLGAISFLNNLIKQKKYADYILFLDYAFNPYGTKNEYILYERLLSAMQFLKNKGCEKIIIACNTLSIIAINNNIDNVIIPLTSFKNWLINNEEDNSLLLATNYTINNNYYNFKSRKSSDLVAIVEGHNHQKFNNIKNELKKYKYLYLGCTHFNLLKDKLKDHILFDSSICLTNNIDISNNNPLNVTIYSTLKNVNITNHLMYHLHINKFNIHYINNN